MKCDTCGKEEEPLRRTLIADNYNAMNRPPLWNCKECYDKKNKEHGRNK